MSVKCCGLELGLTRAAAVVNAAHVFSSGVLPSDANAHTLAFKV